MKLSRVKVTRILLGFQPPLSDENVSEITNRLFAAEKEAVAEAKRIAAEKKAASK